MIIWMIDDVVFYHLIELKGFLDPFVVSMHRLYSSQLYDVDLWSWHHLLFPEFIVRCFGLVVSIVITGTHDQDDGLIFCSYDCSRIHGFGSWTEDLLPLDPCIMI